MTNGGRRPGRGRVGAAQIVPAHAEGFNRALERALKQLPTGKESKKYEVRFSVVVEPNPGEIGEYVVELG